MEPRGSVLIMFSINEDWCGNHSEQLYDSLFAKDSSQTKDKQRKKKLSSKERSAGAASKRTTVLRGGDGSKLRRRVTGKLLGAKFRWLNQKLYGCTGKEALELFSQDEELFDIYHEGFNEQVSKWPLNPLDCVIDFVKSLPKSYTIADFGCGEGRLGTSVEQTVHSFDLVSRASHVTSCDMSNVPLPDASVDVVVFCLSLMGTDIASFVAEACRVLRKGGILKIIEIESRMESHEDFIAKIEKFGFELVEMDKLSKLFLDFKFILKKKRKLKVLPIIVLEPCLYKKR